MEQVGGELELETLERVIREIAEAWTSRPLRSAFGRLGTAARAASADAARLLCLLETRGFLRGAERGCFLCSLFRTLTRFSLSLTLLFEASLSELFFSLKLFLSLTFRFESLLLHHSHLGLVLVPEEGTDTDTADKKDDHEPDGPGRHLLLLCLEAFLLELDASESFGLFGLCLGLGLLEHSKALELGVAALALFCVLSGFLFSEPPLFFLAAFSLFFFTTLSLFFFASASFFFFCRSLLLFFGFEALVLELHQILQRKLDRVFLGVLRHLPDLTYAALP